MAEKIEYKSFADERKKEKLQENLKKIEDVHLIKENAIKAKESVTREKIKNTAAIINENRELQKVAHQQQEEELARKVQLIQQIRLLENAITLNKQIPKEIDLTETSGLGLLGEMSIMEVRRNLLTR